jgi:hypothetical protein
MARNIPSSSRTFHEDLPKQHQPRAAYEVSPSGYGIHWPLVDEDLSIDGLLGIKHRPKSTGAKMAVWAKQESHLPALPNKENTMAPIKVAAACPCKRSAYTRKNTPTITTRDRAT